MVYIKQPEQKASLYRLKGIAHKLPPAMVKELKKKLSECGLKYKDMHIEITDEDAKKYGL